MAKEEKKYFSGNQALREIRQKRIAPLYWILGEEVYLAEQIRKAILVALLGTEKDDFNYHQFYGKEIRIELLIDALSSYPVMAERKVVILKEADSLKKEEKDALIPFVEKPFDTVCFVVMSEKADFRQKFFQTLKAHAVVVHVEPLNENDMPETIRRMLGEKGKTISDEAVMLMSERLNLSLQEIEIEADKLASYTGSKERIETEDVEAVIGVSRQYHVFELCRKIAEKDFSGSLHVFRQMRLRGEEPAGMIALIFRHFNILWQAAECMHQALSSKDIEQFMMEHFKLYSSITESYIQQARQFPRNHLQNTFKYLLEADREVKSSTIRPDLIMEKLIYQLIFGDRL